MGHIGLLFVVGALVGCTIPEARHPTSDVEGYKHCRSTNEAARTRAGLMFSYGVGAALASGATVIASAAIAANPEPSNNKRFKVIQAALPGTGVMFALLARSFFAQEEAASALAEATANGVNESSGLLAAKKCNASIGTWNAARSNASAVVQQSLRDSKAVAEARSSELEEENRELREKLKLKPLTEKPEPQATPDSNEGEAKPANEPGG